MLNVKTKLENCPWSRIEVRPTASSPWPVTFSFNLLQAILVSHTHAKDQQHSRLKVCRSEKQKRMDRQMDGWTDAVLNTEFKSSKCSRVSHSTMLSYLSIHRSSGLVCQITRTQVLISIITLYQQCMSKQSNAAESKIYMYSICTLMLLVWWQQGYPVYKNAWSKSVRGLPIASSASYSVKLDQLN